MKEPLIEKIRKPKSKNRYDGFARQAHSVGFTDDQLDFLWGYLTTAALGDYETFTHPDNYSKGK